MTSKRNTNLFFKYFLYLKLCSTNFLYNPLLSDNNLVDDINLVDINNVVSDIKV